MSGRGRMAASLAGAALAGCAGGAIMAGDAGGAAFYLAGAVALWGAVLL